MGLTITQKILRPILNWTVETFYPDGAFYGGDYLKTLESDNGLIEKWGSVEMACAMLITSRLRKRGATSAKLEATDVTDCGEPVGSWMVTIEQVDE